MSFVSSSVRPFFCPTFGAVDLCARFLCLLLSRGQILSFPFLSSKNSVKPLIQDFYWVNHTSNNSGFYFMSFALLRKTRINRKCNKEQ